MTPPSMALGYELRKQSFFQRTWFPKNGYINLYNYMLQLPCSSEVDCCCNSSCCCVHSDLSLIVSTSNSNFKSEAICMDFYHNDTFVRLIGLVRLHNGHVILVLFICSQYKMRPLHHSDLICSITALVFEAAPVLQLKWLADDLWICTSLCIPL